MAVDVESTSVAETAMVIEEPSVIETDSSGFDESSQESYLDVQPESSIPDRSYLLSSYDYSSFPSTPPSSFVVNSPFGDHPATPLANLHSTAGFASFASSSPSSSYQASSMASSYFVSPTSTLPPTLPRTPTPIAPSSSAPRAHNAPLPFPAAAATATDGPSSTRHSQNMAIIDQIEAEEEKKEKERSAAKNLLKMLEERRRAVVRTYEDIEA